MSIDHPHGGGEEKTKPVDLEFLAKCISNADPDKTFVIAYIFNEPDVLTNDLGAARALGTSEYSYFLNGSKVELCH